MTNALNQVFHQNILVGQGMGAAVVPLRVRFAQNEDDILQVQALRAETFSEAYGVMFAHQLDQDIYDNFCDHLMVMDGDILVATTRLLRHTDISFLGGFYSELSFDIPMLSDKVRKQVLEVGRTCIRSSHRRNVSLELIWKKVLSYCLKHHCHILIGSASVATNKGSAQIWLDECIAPERKLSNVLSKQPVIGAKTACAPPSLLRAYDAMNSTFGATSFLDNTFNCEDVFVWLDLTKMNSAILERLMH